MKHRCFKTCSALVLSAISINPMKAGGEVSPCVWASHALTPPSWCLCGPEDSHPVWNTKFHKILEDSVANGDNLGTFIPGRGCKSSRHAVFVFQSSEGKGQNFKSISNTREKRVQKDKPKHSF